MYNKITLNGDRDESSEGITSYLELENLPTINAVTVKGNLTGDDLGLVSESADQDIFGAKNFAGTLTYKGVEVATESSVAEDISVKADKTDVDMLSEAIDVVGDTIKVINTTLEGKADKTEVSTLTETVNALSTIVDGKAEQTQVDKVDTDLNNLIGVVDKTIDTVGALSEEVKTKASVTEVQTALGEKADKTELPVAATVENIGLVKPDGNSIKIEEDGTIRVVGGGSGTTNYEDLQNRPKINDVELIGNKSVGDLGLATAQDIVDVNAALTEKADKTELENKADKSDLENKADKSEITTLQETLANKADKTELENKADKTDVSTLTETVNTLSTTVEGKVDSSTVSALETTVEGKADKSEITTLQESIEGKADKTELENKADISTVSALETTVQSKADKSELPTVATTTQVGTVKPDGTTITIKEDGTISSTSSGGDTSVPVTPLEYAESINLEVDKAYTLTATGNVTFVLPTVTDTSVLPQIFMQFKMDTVVTIDLGTSTYFKKSAPDMTVAGIYNIIWEYDLNNGVWAVDSVIKGEVE